MYGYGYKINSGLVVGAGGGGGGFTNTYSLDFDGVDDKVEIGTQSLGITGAISVSAWVKIPTTNTGGASPFIQIIVGEDTKAGTNRNWALFWRGGTTLNGFSAFIYDSSGAYVTVNSALPTPNDNQWHHLMFTYTGDTSTDGLKLFVDGVQIAQATSSNGGLRASTSVIPTIGGVSNTIQRMFEGSIDEASIFDSAVSIGDVWDGSGTPTDLSLLATPPIHWYRMGDNGSYKSPQWLLPNNENFAANKVSNYSFEFDGVDDYLAIANNTTIGRTQNISYSIWVNLNATSRQYLIGNTSSSNRGAGIAIESGDNLVFQMGDGTNDSFFNSRVSSFSTYAPLNTWNHILATWDGTDSKIYINGVLRNTWSPTLPYTILYPSAFDIGWRGFGAYKTNGKLDEMALFDSGVSIGDVWDGSGEPIDVSAVSGLTNNWRMGEEATFSGGVWNVPDSVGSNNGTSNGMTIEDRIGDAPNSTNNALSYNMDEVDRVTDVP